MPLFIAEFVVNNTSCYFFIETDDIEEARKKLTQEDPEDLMTDMQLSTEVLKRKGMKFYFHGITTDSLAKTKELVAIREVKGGMAFVSTEN